MHSTGILASFSLTRTDTQHTHIIHQSLSLSLPPSIFPLCFLSLSLVRHVFPGRAAHSQVGGVATRQGKGHRLAAEHHQGHRHRQRTYEATLVVCVSSKALTFLPSPF